MLGVRGGGVLHKAPSGSGGLFPERREELAGNEPVGRRELSQQPVRRCHNSTTLNPERRTGRREKKKAPLWT